MVLNFNHPSQHLFRQLHLTNYISKIAHLANLLAQGLFQVEFEHRAHVLALQKIIVLVMNREVLGKAGDFFWR